MLVVDYTRVLLLRRKMPPGPFPLPIIGNIHLLPDRKPWIYFEQLAKEYNSPVITFWMGCRPNVWLNDAQSASDLFDKRAATFSSRPLMVVFGELAFGQSSLVTMYYGDRFRVHRKLTHMGVGMQQVRGYQHLQSDENKVVLYDLLNDSENYVAHLERYAASVVSIIGFGRRISTVTDPIITEVIFLMQRAAEHNVPGNSFPMIMESFPILAKFPRWMAPWMENMGKPRAKNFFYALAEEAAHSEEGKDNYAKKLFELAPKYNLSEMELSTLSGSLFGAGSDTSSSTLITFLLACCAFPEVLPKAWEELDRIVGPHRSPTFEDEANLPYVKAFAKEVLRWRSVAIIGGQPHAPIQDEIYKGWLIPKNTWTQGNVWAIHRNEEDFPDPDRFQPERFLKDSPHHRPFPNERGYMTFGWGRRVCAGQALAEQGTFISVARLLWAFNIQKGLDESGNEIPVDIFSYTDGLNIRPNPFKCRITARNDEIKSTIEREGKGALDNLSVYNGETKFRISTYHLENQ
ncbi:cytochrome P450 monooxygenase [Hyaloscypha bicolor E]|uniref:Cytochrome P450 monooxygenase n=1 Tax=Hyaloscypha bicolor E TaxID=1095630 RepID=A0A2J6T4U9_9HELO|nr:cytochrome P450 monooxygenase [Hyaloscypha bicolor E]PMD58045.1 cytochrome P450 monooxygenase [Hyaloscypha bicolor E]